MKIGPNLTKLAKQAKFGASRVDKPIQNLETFEVGSQMVWFSIGYGYRYSPYHLKTGTFKIRMFLSGFQMYANPVIWVCAFQKQVFMYAPTC